MREPDSGVDELARQVIGAAIEVHRHLGPGLLEAVYEEALAHEFDLRGIAYQRQVWVQIEYKSIVAGKGKADFIVAGRLPVELKAAESIHPIFLAQTTNYLRAIHEPLALIINFNELILKNGIRRVVCTT